MEGRIATRSLRPEVAKLWMRRAFREWPGCERRWIDLAQGAMRRGGDAPSLPDVRTIDVDGGLLYVPPVDEAMAPARDELVAALALRGVPLLVQVLAGDRLEFSPPPEAVVVDPLHALLERRLDLLDVAPAQSAVVWPLIAGLTDDEALWNDGCRRLRVAGVACVQALVLDLPPADRRELAGEEREGVVFSRLFHGRAVNERRFAVTAAGQGLDVFFRRRQEPTDRKARNAVAAEMLALAGEVWLRLGRSEVQGQELFRASRWVEDSGVDVRAMAAEGNLEIVEALRAPLAAEIVAEWSRTGGSAAVESWLAEYARGEA